MLDPITIGVVGLVILFVLLILRMPVGIAMILVGIGGTYVLSLALPYVRFVPYLRQFKTLLWENVASYDLSAKTLNTIKASGVTKFGFVGNEQYRTFGK